MRHHRLRPHRLRTHDPAGKLIHDNQDPVGPQRGRLALEQIHAPEAVFHVAQDRQPGGTTSVLARPVVMGENPSNHVFVDLDVERRGDVLGDARTAPVRITFLHFDDRTDEFCARSFRAGLPTAFRGEQHAVLLPAQGLVKAQQCRGLQYDCRTEQTSWTHQERHPAGEEAVRRAEIGGSLPGAIQEQELVFEEKRLSNDGTDTARSEQAGQGSDQVEEKNDQIAHRRIVAGRGILRNHPRNNNSPETRGCFQKTKTITLPIVP